MMRRIRTVAASAFRLMNLHGPPSIIVCELNEFLGSFNTLLTFNPEAYPSFLVMPGCSVMLGFAFLKHPCLILL